MENTKNYIRVLIVGRPNVGKTSFVNCISGSNLKVGNFTGWDVIEDFVHLNSRNPSQLTSWDRRQCSQYISNLQREELDHGHVN